MDIELGLACIVVYAKIIWCVALRHQLVYGFGNCTFGYTAIFIVIID